MKKIFTTLLLFLGLINVSAQYSETINAGRPGQAMGTKAIGKNIFQIETGVDYFQKGKLTTPNTGLKYGISDRIDINAALGYSFSSNFNQLSTFSIGTFINLYNSEKLPIGMQLSYNVPVANLQSSGSVMFSTVTSLTQNLNLGFNLGTIFAKGTDANALYVVNLSYSVNDKIGVFVEPYGTISNDFEINFDTGISYLVNKDLQLDFLGGYGLNNDNGLMLSVGFSWRTNFFQSKE